MAQGLEKHTRAVGESRTHRQAGHKTKQRIRTHGRTVGCGSFVYPFIHPPMYSSIYLPFNHLFIQTTSSFQTFNLIYPFFKFPTHQLIYPHAMCLSSVHSLAHPLISPFFIFTYWTTHPCPLIPTHFPVIHLLPVM